MNNIIKISLACALLTPLMSSCLKEFEPTSSVSQEEVNKADKSGLVNAIPAYLNNYSSDDYYDIGFGGFNIWKDASTADLVIKSSVYDYFWQVGSCENLGAQMTPSTMYRRYYALVQKCNLVLTAIDPDNKPEEESYATMAYAYRAYAYYEMAQWYEYKRTGFASLDSKAESSGIYGLTVPIVTETTTDTESRHNPRAPFYTMYRFILTDLNKAEKYAEGKGEPANKTEAGLGVVYGLKARFWLTLGTRFDTYANDLATALGHENDEALTFDKLGVNSAKECFELAAEYARKAINRGYTPTTETQWFDPTTGFNTVNNAWMWADIINADNGLAKTCTWQSWVSFLSPEATYGVCTTEYKAYRMIDSRLFDKIPSADWRKTTWIDPKDVGKESAFNQKYARGLNIGYSTWAEFDAYCGFKFHPGGGAISTSTVGNAISIPMMRIEEMYLIEAEAVGRSQGESAGRTLLEQFVNTYRYTNGSYMSQGDGLDGFIDDVFTQKRIEFWGEGIVLWDYRRLEKPVTRGYDGTNWPTTYQFNSNANAVAPWSTLCIPQREITYNTDIVNNPDPSSGGAYSAWDGE